MINNIHRLIYRPENGWDPVDIEYCNKYANSEWDIGVDQKLIKNLETQLCGFEDKQILDLGGGPGQYAVEFAKRGGNVDIDFLFDKWHLYCKYKCKYI